MSSHLHPLQILQFRVRDVLEGFRDYYQLMEPEVARQREREGWTWPAGYTGFRDEQGEMIMAASDEMPVAP